MNDLQWWCSWISDVDNGEPRIDWLGPFGTREEAEEAGMTYDNWHPCNYPPPDYRLPRPGLFVWSTPATKEKQ